MAAQVAGTPKKPPAACVGHEARMRLPVGKMW